MFQALHLLHRLVLACGAERVGSFARANPVVYGEEAGVWLGRRNHQRLGSNPRWPVRVVWAAIRMMIVPSIII